MATGFFYLLTKFTEVRGKKYFFQMNGIAISITGCWEKNVGAGAKKNNGGRKV